MRPFAIVPLLTVLASGLIAQPSQTVDLVVTPAWLAERLADAEPNIVVLHVEHDDYRDGHIPGARELDYDDIVTQRNGLRAELPTDDELREVFERLGVSDSSYVIVYAHEAPMATRVLFSLAAIGHGRLALLDGGLRRWRAEGHAISRENPVVTPGRLSARTASEPVVVDAAWISEQVGNPAVALVDTRTDGEYNGTGNRSGMPSTGHLAGARQLEWQALFTDGMTRLKARAELEAMFAARADRGDTVVTYCWVGYRASATWFIARYLGYDARMYDGSYQDWRERELPTRRGADPDRGLGVQPLGDYEGVYDYGAGTAVALVSNDSVLFAVLNGSKYPLQHLRGDRFLNNAGDTIPFRRDAGGSVDGFTERGVFYARRTAKVPKAVADVVLATARPLGVDGRPVPYVYEIPMDRNDGIAIGSATAAHVDTTVLRRLVDRIADGTYESVHSVLIHKGGRLVFEEYFYGHSADQKHQMRSATKSVVSALVGIAIGQGLIRDEDVRVTELLPYTSYDHPDARMDSITLRDLLTMRSGLACDDWNPESPGNESRIYRTDDWVKAVLDLPMIADPGTSASYCSGGGKVAARIVELASGVRFDEFGRAELLRPLGIRDADVEWNTTMSASNASTFGQLHLRPRDMLKFGLLFHNDGVWNGQQLVPRAWVERSTAQWSTVGDQRYGYFWWHQWVHARVPSGMRRVDMVLASGNGGQKIYLVPEFDLVVVLTGGAYNESSAATAVMINEILPAVIGPEGE